MNNVGFKVDVVWSEFGYGETLYSFFSTICYNLEDKKWGSRFPIIMNDLYYDEEIGVRYEDIEEFKKEIEIVQNEFKKLKPKDAIWSFEDEIFEVPKDKPNINYEAENLSDFYINLGGNSIYKQFEKICERMLFFKANCKIELE